MTESTEPPEVLKALQAHFGCNACYVADLDAIEGRQLNRCTIAEMVRTGVLLIVDAGAASIEQVESLLEIGVSKVVLASESFDDLTGLKAILHHVDPDSLIFSIDLKHGELRVQDPLWKNQSPLNLARFVIDQGIRQLIVLDLAAVGTGHGILTLKLCCEIRKLSPDVQITSGGGVNSRQCITDAVRAGLDALLIASALHDGRLNLHDLESGAGENK